MPIEARDIHVRSLATSSALSEYYMPNLITPLEVIRVLNAVRVKFMLLGAHGLGGWMGKPRATEDVDVLVGTRGHKKAVSALLAAFPHLQAEDHEVVTRLRDPETGTIVIDVMKPNQPLYRDALKYRHTVQSGGQTYSIPSLELALTTKFAAMISLTRADRDKFQDARDFMYIVDSNPGIDLVKLRALGQLVYNGGGDEIVENVRKVRAGEKLTL
ncbi:MAG TPA: hypothetical protein VH643_30375 [Gemmataceae bacterium]|jgi:hypothetical protein